jgi:hypothetical protein
MTRRSTAAKIVTGCRAAAWRVIAVIACHKDNKIADPRLSSAVFSNCGGDRCRSVDNTAAAKAMSKTQTTLF